MRLGDRWRRRDVGHFRLLIDELTRGLPRRFSRGGPEESEFVDWHEKSVGGPGMPILLKETRLEKSEHRGLGPRRIGHHHAGTGRVVALGAGDCGHCCVPHPAARVRGVYLWLRAYRSAFLGPTFALVSRETAGAGPGSVFARVRLASVEAGSSARADGRAVSCVALLSTPQPHCEDFPILEEIPTRWPVHGERLSYQGPDAGPSCGAAGGIFLFSICEGQVVGWGVVVSSEVLVEDRTAGPAETAAARIDWADWL